MVPWTGRSYRPLLVILLWWASLSGGQAAWQESSGTAVPGLTREFRGAWLTTVYNLDWPGRPGLPALAQQKEMRHLLDRAQELGLNAVLFQVRPGGDALYPSALEPWSAVLTGRMGADPGYDPLQFAITEAHRRGLGLHAWFNPFRAQAGNAAATENHWTQRHPDWVRGSRSHRFMDPGLPAVQAHVLTVMKDVLTRYDIDGLHIDDYFYPYPVFAAGGALVEVPLGDEARWKAEASGTTLGDWRRDHINRFVRSMYALTHSIRPTARVGISPFGIWQPGYPQGIEAKVNAFEHLYGDSRRWLQEGWCDYLAPQLYWPIEPSRQSFTALLSWWNGQSRGRPVWPGISAERIASPKAPTLPIQELTRQLAAVRTASPMPGALLWRIRSLAADTRGIGTELQSQSWSGRAVPPAAPWLGQEIPSKPVMAAPTAAAGAAPGVSLSWSPAPGSEAPRWWALQILHEGKWIQQSLRFGSETATTLPFAPRAVSLRAISGSGMASSPAVWEQSDP